MKSDKNHPERPIFGWRSSEDMPIKERPVFTPEDIIFTILLWGAALWALDLFVQLPFGFGLGLDVASIVLVFLLIGAAFFSNS